MSGFHKWLLDNDIISSTDEEVIKNELSSNELEELEELYLSKQDAFL
jgi:hypothetical protein